MYIIYYILYIITKIVFPLFTNAYYVWLFRQYFQIENR